MQHSPRFPPQPVIRDPDENAFIIAAFVLAGLMILYFGIKWIWRT
jgi:hypothetical protein